MLYFIWNIRENNTKYNRYTVTTAGIVYNYGDETEDDSDRTLQAICKIQHRH